MLPLPSLGFSTTRILEGMSGEVAFGSNVFAPFSRSGPSPLIVGIVAVAAVAATALVVRS